LQQRHQQSLGVNNPSFNEYYEQYEESEDGSHHPQVMIENLSDDPMLAQSSEEESKVAHSHH